MDISQIINELGEDREYYFNAVAPPIIQTSNFVFNKVADLSKAFEDEMGGYLYSRGLNPSPDLIFAKIPAKIAAAPLLKTRQSSAPSNAASFFRSISTVGFNPRL